MGGEDQGSLDAPVRPRPTSVLHARLGGQVHGGPPCGRFQVGSSSGRYLVPVYNMWGQARRVIRMQGCAVRHAVIMCFCYRRYGT